MTVRHPLSERWWSARADHPVPQHFACADAMSHALDMLYATLIDIANSSGPQDQRRNFHEGCTPEDAFRNGIATARFEAAEKARFVILGFEEGSPSSPEPKRYVTRDMALDAGEPGMEGQPL